MPRTLTFDSRPLDAPRDWWQVPFLRGVLADTQSTLLAHDFGPDRGRPDYAFLALDSAGVRRSVVLARVADWLTAAAFDYIGGQEVEWRPEGEGQERLIHRRDDMLLHFVEPPGRATAALDVTSPDMAGVRVEDWQIHFYADARPARGTFSFTAASPARILLTGLAPGMWEIWRNGWLEEDQALVAPPAASLYWDGVAGGYFLRRLG